MTPARQDLLAHLARAAAARRRRRAARRAAAGLCLLAGLLLTAGLVLSFAPALRPMMLVAMASVGLVAVASVVAALLRRDAPPAVAAWLARRKPGLGGALADAVEFSSGLDEGRSIATGSDELARAHVESAARLARGDDPARHAREALPPPPWGTAAGLLAAASAALLLLPAGREALLHGPPPPAAPRVAYGAVELTFRFPAYLGRPDATQAGSGDIDAPVGTHVDVRVRADRPLQSGRLEPEGAAPVEMRIAGDTASGTLVVAKSGSYRLALRGSRGEVDPDPPKHVIRAQPDALPVVRLRAPRQDVVLSEGEQLGIDWIAEDDHGIAEAALVVRLGSSDDRSEPGAADPDAKRIPLGEFDPPEADRQGSAAPSTTDLGLVPGDTAWLWVEARDDDQVTGPKWAASSRVRVTMRSERERESALEQGEQELAEALLAALGQHLLASPERLPDAAAVAATHREFLPRVAQLSTSAGELADAAQEEMEDAAGAGALRDMASRLESLARTRARRGDALQSGDVADARAAHAQLHPKEIEELERDVLFFDMWADRRSSLRAADAADELLAAAQALREAAEKTSPEATNEELLAAAADAAAAAQALEPLLRQLAESPGADPASAAAARETLSAALEAARSMQARLSKGDRSSAGQGSRRLEDLASDLAGIVSDLADAAATGDPELVKEVERAEADLRRLRREQADLRDETNRLRDEMRRAMSAEDMKQAEEGFAELDRLAKEAVAAHAAGDARVGKAEGVASFFQAIEERARVEEAMGRLLESGAALQPEGMREFERLREKHADAVAGEMASSGLVESLMRSSQGAREMLSRLQQVIADRDLGAASRPARWALSLLQSLQQDVAETDDADVAAAEPDFRTAAARTSEILEKLEQMERQMERAAQQAMTAAQRQQAAQLGRRQGGLQDRSSELAARLRRLGADAPFLGQDVADHVDEASGHMDQASRGLFGQKPGEASESQGEAVAKLKEAADALSPTGNREDGGSRGGQGQQQAGGQGGDREGRDGQERRRGSQGERGRESRFGRNSRERVEIPDADAYKVPKEFREEILESMRESSAPEGYAEQVREYFRRLVE